MTANEPKLTLTEKKGHILLIKLNRPEERNAMNSKMILQLSEAYSQLEDDPELRCGVVYAEGKHFTLGLELDEVSNLLKKERKYIYAESIDPWDAGGGKIIRKKPVVCAVHGFCFTLGIELMLASDIRIAAVNTRFAQVEVQRGIAPFGGATARFVQCAGYGNAMRYILTGDDFGAEEALRMGLIQEAVDKKDLITRAIFLAERIAEQAPLAVQATRLSSRKYLMQSMQECFNDLLPMTLSLMETKDAAEGVNSFKEKRKANFSGE